MSFFRFFFRPKAQTKVSAREPIAATSLPQTMNHSTLIDTDVRRYFHNPRELQCYTSWFAHWGGWISAGHCLTETQDHLPSFAAGHDFIKWPDGLDAALVGCELPLRRPTDPVVGQEVIIQGFPAGSRHIEIRTGKVYFERNPGQWITHIFQPNEPVVTGMSGGPVLDAKTGVPIGITITRNSPADLDNDRAPDESADFIALSSVWDAVKLDVNPPAIV